MPAAAVPNPPFYDDLAASLAEAWRLLKLGATDRHSAMHTPAVASAGLDGRPRVRTVVLRDTDTAARTLRFHTDIRAGKIAEFAANPAVQVLAYDPGHKVQVRALGHAAVHHGDAVAQAAFAASQFQSQLCYRQGAAPGTLATDPAVALQAAAHGGEENFAAVVITVTEIDWLYLAASGHRRARFKWDDGTLNATWLAP